MAADRAKGIALDSSVVIVHLRERLGVFSLLGPGEELYLPLIALAELYKGAKKSTRAEHNRQLVDDFLASVNLLRPNLNTAEVYASTAVVSEARGQPLADNDLWIAAAALEFDMPLATRDAHFGRVLGLTVLAW